MKIAYTFLWLSGILNSSVPHEARCFLSAIREDGMPGGRNKSIGPVQVSMAASLRFPSAVAALAVALARTHTHARTLGWWARAAARCGVGVRSVWRGLSCPAEPFSPPVGAAGLWLPAALGIHLVNGRRVSKAQHLLVPEGTRVVPRYLCDTGLRPSRCSVLPEPHKDVCPSAAPSKSPGLPAAIPSVVASGAPSKCLAD